MTDQSRHGFVPYDERDDEADKLTALLNTMAPESTVVIKVGKRELVIPLQARDDLLDRDMGPQNLKPYDQD